MSSRHSAIRVYVPVLARKLGDFLVIGQRGQRQQAAGVSPCVIAHHPHLGHSPPATRETCLPCCAATSGHCPKGSSTFHATNRRPPHERALCRLTQAWPQRILGTLTSSNTTTVFSSIFSCRQLFQDTPSQPSRNSTTEHSRRIESSPLTAHHPTNTLTAQNHNHV